MPQAQDLVDRAARVVPAITGARAEAARLALRPIPADSYSAVGPIPGLDGYYLVVTHSGVTLGPYLGRLVAGEIAGGSPAPELATFRPARFFSGNRGPQ
jgi:glycine/D-amino acid oxidase-like deaminating enzyme